MAEEEKVLVAEISNEALNQLKKAFEPTAEEKFEAKRIKAALAGGGGGKGSGYTSSPAAAGTANTGGGGGGTPWTTTAANAGSGVVILRIPTASYSGTTTGSPSASTDGADTILVYNSSGSYTA